MIFALPVATAMLGYDCGGAGLNITTLSLLDIGTCEINDIEPKQEEVYVQLMQTSEYETTTITQCKVEVDRTVYHCGMWSHLSIAPGGRREYIMEIGMAACKKLYETGTITIGNSLLSMLTRNATNRRSAILAGTIHSDFRCGGVAHYSDAYGSWDDDVVVQASVKITLKEMQAPIHRSTGRITLPDGTRCPVNEGGCLDSDGAETYWPVLPVDTCHFDKYDVLYEGLATKLTPKSGHDLPVVYTVTKSVLFSLTKVAERNICGYNLIQTEHPKLFLLETEKGRTFKTRGKISVDNLDIFTYVNSKFVYVERHLQTQLTQLYKDIMEQKCALERQILRNALSLAAIAPDEMASRIMKAPGYTAVTTGEVMHLIKCVPVSCKFRSTEGCYNELPVTHGNSSYFLSPRTKILIRKGTPRNCDTPLPTMYQIQGTWYRATPRLSESPPPATIKPLTHPTWKYVSPTDLATDGIYDDEQLERLRTHIMFPVERPAMLNTIVQGAMGENVPAGSISMLNLLDEASINKIAESAGARMWKGFITFGSASAGILAIFIIARLVKLVIDTLIHGYALHSVYGWSLHLLGAIWSSVTHLLLHLGSRPEKSTAAKGERESATAPPPSTEDRLLAPVTVSASEKDAHQYSYKNLRKYLRDEAGDETV